MRLNIGEVAAPHNHVYKWVHGMEVVRAHHWPPVAYYLFVCADVVWPNDPQHELRRRVFTMLMQYSETLGEKVENYPAHIVPDDLDDALSKYQTFIQDCCVEQQFLPPAYADFLSRYKIAGESETSK